MRNGGPSANPGNFNAANWITLSRFLLTLVFMGLLVSDGFLFKLSALFVFLLACLTDFIDGYIARKLNQVTTLGQLLDPIADKVLIFSALILFVEMGILPAWMVIVMLTREVLITGFRFLGASRGISLAAERGGKNKTALQAVSIAVILIYLAFVETPFWNPQWVMISLRIIYWFMLVVVGSTLISGISYTVRNWKRVNGSYS